jgi:hypothetical protein
MTQTLPIVLLGSRLYLDTAAFVLMACIAALFVAIALSPGASQRRSGGAWLAYGCALIGALLQCVAAEFLLYLAAGAILGYGLLALALTGPRPLAPIRAATVAMLLLAGDLALLELAMLIGKSDTSLAFTEAGVALAQLRDDAFAQFCLILGFGSRVALLILFLSRSPLPSATLPQLCAGAALALASSAGAVRLSCAGGFGVQCAEPLVDVLWWVPVLAATALFLPRLSPWLLLAMQRLGDCIARRRDRLQERLLGMLRGGAGLRLRALHVEAGLVQWPVAMAAAVVVAAVLAMFLLH